MTYFQGCARCGAKWGVGAAPATWCPRCNGVLMAPESDNAVPDPGRQAPPIQRSHPTRPPSFPAHPPVRTGRTFRWVARSPTHHRRAPAAPARPSPTPSYAETPQWGLIDRPRTLPVEERTSAESLAVMAPRLLTITTILFVAAALGELARYILLLVGRTSLTSPLVLGISDATELFLSSLATIFGVATAVACASWLIVARRHAEVADPRRWWIIAGGSLIPFLNLIMPGVFLSELKAMTPHRAGLAAAIRWWWVAWIVNWVFVATAIAWRFRDGAQAQANGVFLAVIVDLVAAVTAALTLMLIRRFHGLDARGNARHVQRWTVASPAQKTAEPAAS